MLFIELYCLDPAAMHMLGELFVLYLNEHARRPPDFHPPQAGTAASYLSAVIYQLTSHDVIQRSDQFRNAGTSQMLAGWAKEEIPRLGALRLRLNIAVSLPILFEMINISHTMHLCDDRRWVSANAALGFTAYFFSFRIGDVAYPHIIQDGRPRMTGDQMVFWFDGITDPVPVSFPQDYPPALRPSCVSILPDFDKANQTGNLPMRARGANPNANEFCIVGFLFDFFSLHPPHPGALLFSAIPPTIKLYENLNKCLKATALALGLDPKLLLPRGLRAGAVEQLESNNFDEYDQQKLGGWRSWEGFSRYKRANFAFARRTATALHDPAYVNLAQLRYMTSEPSAYAKTHRPFV